MPEAALKSVSFLHRPRAEENLARLRELLSPAALDPVPRLLEQLPDPDTALNTLERFAAAAETDIRAYLAQPARAGRALHYLLTIFAHSPYLADTLIQQPELVYWLEREAGIDRVRACEEFVTELREFATAPASELSSTLARFKRRQYLRIALRDILRLATLAETTIELSALADGILQFTLDRAIDDLKQRYGSPQLEGGGDCTAAILSLGKLGGNELNYSSDIDLIFLYRANGETTGGMSNKEFFVKVAHCVVRALTAFGPDGAVFRVDLRLRPQGREGDMACSLEGAREYYRNRARDWELQALLKARHSAGDGALSREFLDSVLALIYRTTVNFAAIDSVLFARERISEALKRRSIGTLGTDVKLERGGIRDIEFLAQCLQRLYGGREPWLRSAGTLFALQKLADKGYLTQRDFARLSRAYTFLRNVEHLLQLERGQQTHRMPTAVEALAVLARRAHAVEGVRSQESGGKKHIRAASVSERSPGPEVLKRAADALVSEIERHMKNVREIYDRLILRHSTLEETGAGFSLEPVAPLTAEPGEQQYPELLRSIETNCPPLYEALAHVSVQRGQKTLRRFMSRAYSRSEDFAVLCRYPKLIERAAEVFEYSPYLSELLIRHPGEIEELEALPGGHEILAVEEQQRIPAETAYAVQDDPLLMHIAASDAPLTEKMSAIRRHYRRKLLRIHVHSILGPVPIFSTLEATSVIAEQVIRASYVAAVKETARTMPRPNGELIIVALGRLGIREFDVASDADLGFLYRGGDPEAKVFWTRVAERMIELLSAYTGEGSIFAVDSRLRPRGREGELVESEPTFAAYFSSAAQPWEAITYMKSRVIAGDVTEGTVLLTRIQSTIGERFGRGRDAAVRLAEMRKKLEATGTPQNRLKIAPGGYYDVDFILTYLRLQAAQVFFPSLTTIERLRVVEWMGQLRLEQARVLRDGAIYLRALEHALRVSSGRSDTELPAASGSQAEPFARLAERWLPASLRGKPIPETLESVMTSVRRVFCEVFG